MANIFPKWSNKLPIQVLVAGGVIGTALVAGMTYYFTPKYTRVGYQPVQPVPFSHSIHVNQLGLNCLYCHSQVENAAHSNIPTTQTCMNCHSQIKQNSAKLATVRDSWKTGTPISWVRIHKAPDYVYFNHSAHVNRGVSCVSCHGQINNMAVVWHHEPQSMGWCLTCHRAPENFLRPVNQVTNLNWKPEDEGPGKDGKMRTQQEIGEQLKVAWNVRPPVTCAGCHR